jgi:hypothetical protein
MIQPVDLTNDEPGNLDQLKQDLSDAIQPAEEQPADNPAPAAKPNKYEGKSVDDVIDMHRNAESALGRRNNELGQYKQLTDKLLAMDKRSDDLRQGGASEADIEEDALPELSSTDFLDNPTESVAKVVDARLTHSERKRQARDAEDAMTAAGQDFADKHPDAGEIAHDPEFIEWVKASPLRQRAALAAYNKDFSAGTDLLDEYKSTRKPKEDITVDEQEEARLAAARAASTESTGASQTGDKPTGKVYRRLDLIRLKLEDPEAYSDPAFQTEIMAAYAQGRVK